MLNVLALPHEIKDVIAGPGQVRNALFHSKFGLDVQLTLFTVGILESQPKSGLWAQGVIDILHLPEVVAIGLVAVNCQDLGSRHEALRCWIAIRAHSRDIAMIPKHLGLPAIIVMIRTRRRKEEGMRVIERIQGG